MGYMSVNCLLCLVWIDFPWYLLVCCLLVLFVMFIEFRLEIIILVLDISLVGCLGFY